MLAEFIGKKCLRKNFDGELECDDVDGKLLTDFLDMHKERFEGEMEIKFV